MMEPVAVPTAVAEERGADALCRRPADPKTL